MQAITQGYALRTMAENDLACVLDWRNDSKIVNFMFSRSHISKSDHKIWFTESCQNPSKHLFVLEGPIGRMGFVHFNEVPDQHRADWGFYTSPQAPKGTGQILGVLALEKAFSVLNFHKVCGQVLAYNTRSLSFHTRLGFSKEGVLHEHHFDGMNFHDVVYFGLLKSCWQTNKSKN
jgi:UDP-4-amino-4,6-dideoxy-N-acetyl-beta-L-altrosamine N-acetyltransferase